MLFLVNFELTKYIVIPKIADKILAFYDENHYINITDFVLYLEDEDD